MIIRPIYQTKHVNVEMTQPEVDALKNLYAEVDYLLDAMRKDKNAPEMAELRRAYREAPEIIEEG